MAAVSVQMRKQGTQGTHDALKQKNIDLYRNLLTAEDKYLFFFFLTLDLLQNLENLDWTTNTTLERSVEARWNLFKSTPPAGLVSVIQSVLTASVPPPLARQPPRPIAGGGYFDNIQDIRAKVEKAYKAFQDKWQELTAEKVDIDELKRSVQTGSTRFNNFKDLLMTQRVRLQEAEKALPPTYMKSGFEKYIEEVLVITNTPHTEEEKIAYVEKKKKYLEDCKNLERLETSAEGSTYSDIIKYLQTVKTNVKTELETVMSNPETKPLKSKMIEFMMYLPSPVNGAFDEYKEIWNNATCAPSKKYIPSKGNGKDTKFLLPNFESYVYFILHYLSTDKKIPDVLTGH
jgi:hypothetical protein